MTPLYKHLKPNGTSIYVFPGAAEDISSAYQNGNYKMYFSKYVLLNLPKQNLNPTEPIKFDFESSFFKSNNATPSTGFSDSIIESLRNYVANQEVVIRESRLNDRKYFYNVNSLETVAEKVFWKWCKKVGILDLEPALPGEEYISTLEEFEANDITNDEFFNEILWKERSIIDYRIEFFRQTGEQGFTFPPKLEIEIDSITNFRVGDLVNIYNVSNFAIYSQSELIGSETQEGIKVKILRIINDINKQRLVLDLNSTLPNTFDTTAEIRLIYKPIIVYIGEVNGVSNVSEANRSYTEVYAHIPDHTGKTPDILFRTLDDINYRPNLTFPIIPAQIQPEIIGAEFFNSPIVSSPQDYPGSYFAQFDALDFTYRTSNGDSLRRSGDYYGIKGDRNNPIVDSVKLDGLTLDFDTSHYTKMNIPNNTLTNFDQFNALEVNNNPPRDFEFNSILWYYTVEDQDGNIRNNLYGISFINNPDNNPIEDERGLKFPTLKKLVTNGIQDGTSYAFNLNLNFNIINDNTNEAYNPEAINSLFSMNLFNDAMAKLASTNDSFLNIISEHQFIREEILNVKSLLYTQTDINIINKKIKNLEKLLNLYSTNQLVSSDSIKIEILSGEPSSIKIESIDPFYKKIENIKTSEMFSNQGIIPVNISVPENKTFLINILNDDQIDLKFDDNLSIIIENDLTLNQSLEIIIKGDEFSTQNKKIDIFINTQIDQNITGNVFSPFLLIGDINLPIFYNQNLQRINSSYLWKDFNFNIDFEEDIELIDEETISFSLKESPLIIERSIKIGDVLNINNLLIGSTSIFDFSGQYIITQVENNKIHIDISSNIRFVSTYIDSIFPYKIHNQTSTELAALPYFTLNKGYYIKIIKVDETNEFSKNYSMIINDLKF
jgi:hypothetical protein